MIGEKFTLAIDFDGVIVSHLYPDVGKLHEPAKEFVNRLYDTGRFYIIIWSTRAGEDLDQMVEFLKANSIKYDSINENNPLFIEALNSKLVPEPRKIYYDMVIDDKALPWFDFNDKVAWDLMYKIVLGQEYSVRLEKAKADLRTNSKNDAGVEDKTSEQ